MRELKQLFQQNKAWADKKHSEDDQFFERQTKEHRPRYLWIGCSDSRIPSGELLGLDYGDLFVHRNVANLFVHTDFNCLSVLQYAIDYLKIEHVIVCGHYGCGGVSAAMGSEQHGLVDNWLRNIRDVYSREKEELDAIEDIGKRYERLVELNVLHQVMNVCHTTVVQNAWARQQKVWVHGWVYDIGSGLLNDLDCCVSSIQQVEDVYQTQKLHR